MKKGPFDFPWSEAEDDLLMGKNYSVLIGLAEHMGTVGMSWAYGLFRDVGTFIYFLNLQGVPKSLILKIQVSFKNFNIPAALDLS